MLKKKKIFYAMYWGNMGIAGQKQYKYNDKQKLEKLSLLQLIIVL